MTVKSSKLLILALMTACSTAETPHFDKQNAFQYLEKQCAFGPRDPGSDAHKACLSFLVAELKKTADRVEEQNFTQNLPVVSRSARMTNVIAHFGSGESPVILCAHWDSRPVADEDPDPAMHDKPIPGANDGASGVAVLLELARIFKLKPPPVPVDIILFDGEDAGISRDPDTWCLGSKFYAQSPRVRRNARYAILLDLIGDQDQRLPVEYYSKTYAPQVVDKVWGAAEALGISSFSREDGSGVVDDHLNLLKAGIPAIDLIDFDYPYWHTLEDTPEHCSAESLENIGRVLVQLIYHP